MTRKGTDKNFRRVLIFAFAGLLLLTPALPAREAARPIPEKPASPDWTPSAPHPPRLKAAYLVQPQTLDIEHYKLQLSLFPELGAIAGTVTITGKTTAPTDTIKVDLTDNLQVARLLFNGAPLQFTRSNDRIQIHPPLPLSSAESFTIMIDYRGNPNTVGRFGSGMFFRSHAGVPIVATLSEPYGSPTWWPCIDNPADKTTADMEITVPTGYVAVSNGLLQGVITNADSSRTYIWREQYPIANYLIAVTATNFAEFGDSYPALDGSTMMPLTYYVYPEHLDCARQNFPVTKEALRILAPLFGEYPFLKEQYGMVEFPWGGAMEHQTMTSMGESVVRSGCSSPTSGQSIIVHELAHQWWGDLVTMRTWNDIWLNEGFATYSEVLFKEKYSGMTPGEAIQRYAAGEGTVYAENAADPFDDQLAIYNKGGWVLHMLRRVMGDEAFFKALKEYGRRFAYSNAGTKDFQKVCSEIYGQPLDWFFDQWIYAPSRPIYSLTTTVSANFGGTYSIRLRLEQKQTHLIPNRKQSEQQVYIMPIDFTIHYADGTSEVKTVRNDRRQQDFTFTGGKRPRIETPVVMDEGNWLLKEIRNN